eukprot:45840-Pelagomonas_calceolata.AAC.1
MHYKEKVSHVVCNVTGRLALGASASMYTCSGSLREVLPSPLAAELRPVAADCMVALAAGHMVELAASLNMVPYHYSTSPQACLHLIALQASSCMPDQQGRQLLHTGPLGTILEPLHPLPAAADVCANLDLQWLADSEAAALQHEPPCHPRESLSLHKAHKSPTLHLRSGTALRTRGL